MAFKRFVWDMVNDCLLAETDGSGATTVVYTNEPVPYGRLISQHRGGVTSYYHFDAVGSTRMLTNEAQETTDTYVYTAFGELVASTGSTENPFRYVGEFGYYYDGEALGYYVRERRYEPSLARWLSQDALVEFISELGVEGAYVYTRNTPLMAIDPSGLVCQAPDQDTEGTTCAGADTCGAEILPQLIVTLKYAASMVRQSYPKSQPQCGYVQQLQWDIIPLFQGPVNSFPCVPTTPCCQRCVMVAGIKQDRFEVNYALYGAIMKACNHRLKDALDTAKRWKGIKRFSGWLQNKPPAPCEDPKGYNEFVEGWIRAGFDSTALQWGGHRWNETAAKDTLRNLAPKTDNPYFKDCQPCKTVLSSPPPGESFDFILFRGMRGYSRFDAGDPSC